MMAAIMITGCNKDKDKEETGCDCNEELYYYKNGQKVFIGDLFLNNSLLVAFTSEYEKEMEDYLYLDKWIESYLNGSGIFEPLDWTRGRIIAITGNDVAYIELWLITKVPKTCSQMKNIIHWLENEQLVAYASFTFKNLLTYYPYFFVEVNDLSDLYALMQETNVKVLRNEGNRFTILADKNSKGNALQMANYFYETGKFASVSLEFLN